MLCQLSDGTPLSIKRPICEAVKTNRRPFSSDAMLFICVGCNGSSATKDCNSPVFSKIHNVDADSRSVSRQTPTVASEDALIECPLNQDGVLSFTSEESSKDGRKNTSWLLW